MKKVFRWALLSLAVLGTVVASADNEEPDYRAPIVAVSPSEAIVSPYMEFMMTISYRFTRSILITPSHSNTYVRILDSDDAYKSDIRSFNYYSIINVPNISVQYEIIASNRNFSEIAFADYSSSGAIL